VHRIVNYPDIKMKHASQKALQWVICYSAPALAFILAIFAMWYSHAALAPFSQMRRIMSLEERVRLALYQAESLQRGYLLTNEVALLSKYQAAKADLRLQVNLLAETVRPGREHDIERDAEVLIRLRILELDDTIAAAQQSGLATAIERVQTNIGRNHTEQICDDLALIRGLEMGRTYTRQ
jgi:CHASE3 domain sensor protein